MSDSDRIAALESEKAALEVQIKNLSPIGRYNGLDIEEWFKRATNSEAKLASLTAYDEGEVGEALKIIERALDDEDGHGASFESAKIVATAYRSLKAKLIEKDAIIEHAYNRAHKAEFAAEKAEAALADEMERAGKLVDLLNGLGLLQVAEILLDHNMKATAQAFRDAHSQVRGIFAAAPKAQEKHCQERDNDGTCCHTPSCLDRRAPTKESK